MSNQIEELLEKYKNEINVGQTNSFNDNIDKQTDLEKEIKDINQSIINKVENQKIILRNKLNKTVTRIIWAQLLFFNIIVLIIVLSVTINSSLFKNIDNELASLLFSFLKYYISATIAELLGMLAFILHYVFSKYSGIDKIKNNIKKIYKDAK